MKGLLQKEKAHNTPMYRKHLFFFILVPVAIVILLLSLINFYFLFNVKKQFMAQCLGTHNSFVSTYENDLYSLRQSSMLLFDDDTFRELYYMNTPTAPDQNWLYLYCQEKLAFYIATHPYITNVGFINAANGHYISSNYSVPLENYYNNAFYGSTVNRPDFLDTYEDTNSIFSFLPLDTIDKRTVIPMLQHETGNTKLYSPMIYYLSQKSFSQKLYNYQPTPNSDVVIYCSSTNEVIASSIPKADDSVKNLFSEISEENQGMPEIIRVNGQKYYYYLTNSTSSYCNGLSFLTLIPYHDVRSQTFLSLTIFFLVVSLCVLVAAGLSYYLSKKLYSPVQTILNEKSHLQNSLDTTLPLIYNRYISNIIFEHNYQNLRLEPLLKDLNFSFPYPVFTCAIMMPIYSEEYYTDFSDKERSLISGRFGNFIQTTTVENCVKYVFAITEREYCVLYNTPRENTRDIIMNDYERIHTLFAMDEKYIQLFIGIGDSCYDIHSLHISWQQAHEAFSHLNVLCTNTVQFYEEEEASHSDYLMDADDDTRLSSFLYMGNWEAAKDLLNSILSFNNNELHLTNSALKNLYIHLYELGNSVLRRKRLGGASLMKDDYITLDLFVHKLDNLHRSEYIMAFFSALCEHNAPAAETSFDLEEIKQYIDTYYCEEIDLESLAEHFHTSSKYMSRLLKQALGIPYKTYITTLRIAKAKSLLVGTDDKIDAILTACGFQNRSSFLRSFKQSVGMTPNEYRMSQK